MATKSSTIEIPLSVADCFAQVQSLGAEMGYTSDETRENEYIRWHVKTKLLLLEVHIKPAGESATSLTVTATDKVALVDGAGTLQGLVDNFLHKFREKAGLPTVASADEIPKRSGCLTAFLILAMIGNPILALVQWAMAGNLPSDVAPLAVIGGVLNVAGLVFAIGVWKWRKWGVYGYASSMGLVILLNLMTGQILSAIQGAVPIALLFALTQPVWKNFK